MAKGGNIIINNAIMELKKGWVGINGVARKIKKGWVGVNGVARPLYTAVPAIRYLFNNGSYDAECGRWYLINQYPDAAFLEGCVGTTITAVLDEHDHTYDFDDDGDDESGPPIEGMSLLFAANNAVDITEYKRIVVTGTVTDAPYEASNDNIFGNFGRIILGVSSYKSGFHVTSGSDFDAYVLKSCPKKGSITLTLDISSLRGSKYIYLGFFSYGQQDTAWSIPLITLYSE